MDTARHIISGLEISADAALEDRHATPTRFVPPDFVCSYCGRQAGLRTRGKGVNPFFFHYGRGPRSCPLATYGSAGWGDGDGKAVRRTRSLTELLTNAAYSAYSASLLKADLKQLDKAVARFLSYGIQPHHRPPEDVDIRNFVHNAQGTLYRPQYAIILRGLCARLSERDSTADPFWIEVQEEFLSSDIVDSWKKATELSAAPITRAVYPVDRFQSHHLYALRYSHFWGKLMCLKLNGVRSEVAEVLKTPVTLRIESDAAVVINMTRCRQNSHIAESEDITIDPLGKTLTILEPEAVIFSPHYELQGRDIRRHPFLYVLPGRSL